MPQCLYEAEKSFLLSLKFWDQDHIQSKKPQSYHLCMSGSWYVCKRISQILNIYIKLVLG